jgi:agmatinase
MSDTPFDPDGAAPEGSGVYGLPYTPAEAGVVLVPVPWDATTSYRPGTADGPRAILEASRQVDLFDLETGRPWRAGIAMLPEPAQVRRWNREARRAAEPVIAAGGRIEGSRRLAANLAKVNALGERLNGWVHARCGEVLDAGKVLGLVGGDHSTPFGAMQAVSERHPGVGVLHFDAHADLRDAYEGFTWSHASIFHNVATRLPAVARIVQVGIRDFGEAEHAMILASRGRIVTHFMAEMEAARFAGETWEKRCRRIVKDLPKEVYVSFDIDGLDPVLCPHTGTPVPGGLGFHQACRVIAEVARSGRRIVGFDLNEVAPGDAGDEWDGNVGARLLYKMIGWTLVSRGKR